MRCAKFDIFLAETAYSYQIQINSTDIGSDVINRPLKNQFNVSQTFFTCQSEPNVIIGYVLPVIESVDLNTYPGECTLRIKSVQLDESRYAFIKVLTAVSTQ